VLSVGSDWTLSVCCQSVGIGYCMCVVGRQGLDTVCVLSVGRDRILSVCCQSVGIGYCLCVFSR
jgi:hypothetical protein